MNIFAPIIAWVAAGGAFGMVAAALSDGGWDADVTQNGVITLVVITVGFMFIGLARALERVS